MNNIEHMVYTDYKDSFKRSVEDEVKYSAYLENKIIYSEYLIIFNIYLKIE